MLLITYRSPTLLFVPLLAVIVALFTRPGADLPAGHARRT